MTGTVKVSPLVACEGLAFVRAGEHDAAVERVIELLVAGAIAAPFVFVPVWLVWDRLREHFVNEEYGRQMREAYPHLRKKD